MSGCSRWGAVSGGRGCTKWGAVPSEGLYNEGLY